MELSIAYHLAAETKTGFAAEQVLSRRGFYEIGRRTNAAAWTNDDVNEVIRISEDSPGSEAYFSLAQKMEGNPYMPVVFHQKTLDSGDHIVHVEKLENPSQKHIYPRYKDISNRLNAGLAISVEDRGWFEEAAYAAQKSAAISNFFMSPTYHMDISALPEPDAFREAAVAITELSLQMYKADPHKYVPTPDMNPTNIMWRRVSSGLQPVLYDPVGLMFSPKTEEIRHASVVRQKLGMDPNLNL